MTTIVEFSKGYHNEARRVMDHKAEFFGEVRKSKLVTYTVEYFSSCFLDDKRLMKAINIRLFNIKSNQRPETIEFLISWEDVSQDDNLTWVQFQVKVNRYLRDFLEELLSHSNVFEGSLM